MIPELGHFALILALFISILLSTVPIYGAARGIPGWIALARPAARVQFLLILFSYLALTWAFIQNDFSVAYVANNGNTATPLIYKISGVWGAHEGSLLLWVLTLSTWTVAVSIFSRSVPEQVVARVLGVMGMIAVGFLLFTLLTSNPFDRMVPPPMEGRDLNPLLQDPGLAIHPPMLYMGYVGFAVAFAFAIAAMLGGRLDAAWARWSRPWTTVAWMFLTIGIALGSWWAYYELGWGGWWFWDPVENASFMPWLVGTALIHSLAVTEKRGAFKSWTVFLAIFAFSLSLLGTFLVRSGVLTSVHAFASDPERGVFILGFLLVVIGGSLALYAWRAPMIRSTGRFELQSKEALLLVNNVALVVVAVTILLGTLYPLFHDALGLGKLSVGPPYFNAVFIPLTVPLALAVGIGALARWKKDNLLNLVMRLKWLMVLALVVGVGWPLVWFGGFDVAAAFGGILGVWVAATALFGIWDRVRKKANPVAALVGVPRAFWGMTLAHLGIAVFIIGVSLTSIYSVEKDVALGPGDVFEVSGYAFRFDKVEGHDGPNYHADRGTVTVLKDGEPYTVLHPEKRVYHAQRMPMTEAAIDAGLGRDLYVALGEPVGEGRWAVRVYYKPFVRWIWLGALFMGLGGIVAAADKRYRMGRLAERGSMAADVPAGAATEGR
ncbi:MAG: heme lyase CcmF/NrfE family subunit [Gammaproteobacteria bacterium]